MEGAPHPVLGFPCPPAELGYESEASVVRDCDAHATRVNEEPDYHQLRAKYLLVLGMGDAKHVP
jgi:hypothetical protein